MKANWEDSAWGMAVKGDWEDNGGGGQAVRAMRAEGTYKAMFRGNGTNVVKNVPENAIKLTVNDRMQTLLISGRDHPITLGSTPPLYLSFSSFPFFFFPFFFYPLGQSLRYGVPSIKEFRNRKALFGPRLPLLLGLETGVCNPEIRSWPHYHPFLHPYPKISTSMVRRARKDKRKEGTKE